MRLPSVLVIVTPCCCLLTVLPSPQMTHLLVLFLEFSTRRLYRQLGWLYTLYILPWKWQHNVTGHYRASRSLIGELHAISQNVTCPMLACLIEHHWPNAVFMEPHRALRRLSGALRRTYWHKNSSYRIFAPSAVICIWDYVQILLQPVSKLSCRLCVLCTVSSHL